MIYAIGRNYASHAKELGNKTADKSGGEMPVIFFKPDAALVESGETVKLPAFSSDVQYECELALRFGKDLEIDALAVGNDLTARDKQREAQEKKAPWAWAKGFKQSCGIGNWVPAKGVEFGKLELRLTHNDVLKQHAFVSEMIFDVPTLVKILRDNFPIRSGDIVLTGTPSGVGTVKPGDVVIAEIVGLSRGQWTYA